MSSRSTLVFLCQDPKRYGNFIAEFSSAGFDLLLAHDLTQARSHLVRGRADAIVVRHDGLADDRVLAPKLKSIAPRVPIFLVTDQEQPGQQPDIDAVWRGDFTDDVIARCMAVFFERHLAPHDGKGAPRPLASSLRPFSVLPPRPIV
jgi:hypothetical protein